MPWSAFDAKIRTLNQAPFKSWSDRGCVVGLSLVRSRGCAGVEAPLIRVEVHLSGGLPSMHLVGYINPNAQNAPPVKRGY